jgi:hypothetical protein
MSPTNANQRLPRDAAVTLLELDHLAREVTPSRLDRRIAGGTWEAALLDGYIAKLHYAGWTLQAIADPLGVTRERVRQRCVDATEAAYSSPELPEVPVWVPPVKPRKVSPPQMRSEFQRWLQETYALASRCRGSHAIGSPPRVATEQVWAAIHRVVKQGISCAEVARVVGVQTRTIYAGLSRHGYRKLPPSQQAYEGKPILPYGRKPEPATHCRNGHEFTPENTYVFKQGRLCRTCQQKRSKRAYERKKAGQGATVTKLSDRRLA